MIIASKHVLFYELKDYFSTYLRELTVFLNEIVNFKTFAVSCMGDGSEYMEK
jgi:hypothetical protein